MSLVANSARPVLLGLGQELSGPDTDHRVVEVVCPSPELEELPDQLSQAFLVILPKFWHWLVIVVTLPMPHSPAAPCLVSINLAQCSAMKHTSLFSKSARSCCFMYIVSFGFMYFSLSFNILAATAIKLFPIQIRQQTPKWRMRCTEFKFQN